MAQSKVGALAHFGIGGNSAVPPFDYQVIQVSASVVAMIAALGAVALTHNFASVRDRKNKQREQRIAYLVGAYRALCKADRNENAPPGRVFAHFLAERVGFEPTVPCGTPDFESGTIDHSATSPDSVPLVN